MSWKSYIDNLMAYNCFTHVGMFGLDNGACWASTPNFPLGNDQIKNVLSSIKDTNNAQKGVVVNNEKYVFVRGESGSFALFKNKASGVYAQKSGKCFIIGVHGPAAKAEAVSTAIGKMVDYLVGINY